VRAPRRLNPDWQRFDWTDPARDGGEIVVPEATESERVNRVTLYGPKGEVLRQHIDRPFRGYRAR